MTLVCPHCGRDGTPRLERKGYVAGENSRQHLGAYCLACGRWIKWVPRTEEWLEEWLVQEAGRVSP